MVTAASPTILAQIPLVRFVVDCPTVAVFFAANHVNKSN